MLLNTRFERLIFQVMVLLIFQSCIDSQSSFLYHDLATTSKGIKSCYVTNVDLSHVCLSFELVRSTDEDIESACLNLPNIEPGITSAKFKLGPCDNDDLLSSGDCVANISNEGDRLVKYYYGPIWNEDLAKNDCNARKDFGFYWVSKKFMNISSNSSQPDIEVLKGDSIIDFYHYSVIR